MNQDAWDRDARLVKLINSSFRLLDKPISAKKLKIKDRPKRKSRKLENLGRK